MTLYRREATQPAGSLEATAESQTLAEANNNRAVLYVSNVGTKDAYLALGDKAEAGKGICLAAGDPTLPITDYTGSVTAICSAEETTTLSYSEV